MFDPKEISEKAKRIREQCPIEDRGARALLNQWEADQPKMCRRLRKQGINLEDLALVVQDEYWEAVDRKLDEGLPLDMAQEECAWLRMVEEEEEDRILTPEEVETALLLSEITMGLRPFPNPTSSRSRPTSEKTTT